jgi:phosphatidate phosphatase PAH1
MRITWLLLPCVISCTAPSAPVELDPAEATAAAGKADGLGALPDVQCAGNPDAGATVKFRHFTSKLTAALGGAKHRGFDLVAAAGAETQTLSGAISYTLADKALEDEDVDVFACRAASWKRAGRARTDDEGRFALRLAGDDRLPLGMRDLFVSVAGDRTGARFLAYVAPDGAALIASDVDGTLTSSEGAFLSTIVLGRDADVRAGAAKAFAAAEARGYQLVYVTARGQQYTEETRGWLARMGFPRGPLRLSPSFVTLPGGDTVDYKTSTFEALVAAGLDLAAGVGNRASDIAAYRNAGVAADRIFVETSEYGDELRPETAAGRAIGFASYDELRTAHLATLPQQ